LSGEFVRVIWRPRALAALALAAFGLVALGGCFFHRHSGKYNTCNDPQRYANAQGIAPLKTPAGLTPPNTKGALHIPDLNQPPPPPRTRADPCLDSPPSFVVPKAAKPPQA
jgi:hypothetical protein